MQHKRAKRCNTAAKRVIQSANNRYKYRCLKLPFVLGVRC